MLVTQLEQCEFYTTESSAFVFIIVTIRLACMDKSLFNAINNMFDSVIFHGKNLYYVSKRFEN